MTITKREADIEELVNNWKKNGEFDIGELEWEFIGADGVLASDDVGKHHQQRGRACGLHYRNGNGDKVRRQYLYILGEFSSLRTPCQ